MGVVRNDNKYIGYRLIRAVVESVQCYNTQCLFNSDIFSSEVSVQFPGGGGGEHTTRLANKHNPKSPGVVGTFDAPGSGMPFPRSPVA